MEYFGCCFLLEVEDVISWEVMIGGRVEGWQTKDQINKIIKEYE